MKKRGIQTRTLLQVKHFEVVFIAYSELNYGYVSSCIKTDSFHSFSIEIGICKFVYINGSNENNKAPTSSMSSCIKTDSFHSFSIELGICKFVYINGSNENNNKAPTRSMSSCIKTDSFHHQY